MYYTHWSKFPCGVRMHVKINTYAGSYIEVANETNTNILKLTKSGYSVFPTAQFTTSLRYWQTMFVSFVKNDSFKPIC